MLSLMKNEGFDVTDFSYPYGDRSVESGQLLFNHFKTLRNNLWKRSA